MAAGSKLVRTLKAAILKDAERKIAVARAHVAIDLQNEWARLAKQRMSKNLGVYLNSIVDESGGATVKITLTGKRAQTLEYGTAAYDVKDFLLGPKNTARNMVTKNGKRYADIPFLKSNRASTESLGHNIRARVMQPMKVSAQILMSGKIVQKGVRQTLLQAAKDKGASAAVIDRIKTSGMARLFKDEKRFRTQKGKLKFRSRYVKFMRASRATGPWMRSPVPGAHVVRLLRPRIKGIVTKALRKSGL